MVRNELMHVCGNEVTEGFEVFPLRLRKKVKHLKAGRPTVYGKMDRIVMRGALKRFGLTGAQKYLATERNLSVSLTTLQGVAKQFEIEFKRGRRAA